MMECSNCGFENEDDSAFCMECGNKLLKESENKKDCPKCGAGNDKGSAFCGDCGEGMTRKKEEKKVETPRKEPVDKKSKKEKPKEEKKKEEQPKEDTVTTVEMNFPKNEATKVAQKQLKKTGGLFSKPLEKVEAGVLRYLPLIQASFSVQKKKLFGANEISSESLYFHGFNGKMLQVTESLEFSDITPAKPENIKDLDGNTKFKELPVGLLPKNTEKPRVNKRYISKQLMEMFGAKLEKTNIVYLPIWKFKIEDLKSKKARVLYIDSVFGIPMKKNPFN